MAALHKAGLGLVMVGVAALIGGIVYLVSVLFHSLA